MKKIALLLGMVALLAAGCQPQTKYISYSSAPLTTNRILIHQTPLVVEVASTLEDQQQGLSDRAGMSDDHGMLFDFKGSPPHRPSFWMKDMRFNLDFIWVLNNKVIGITKNVPAPSPASADDETTLREYFPPGDVDTVIEVNAGWADRNNIKAGALITQP